MSEPGFEFEGLGRRSVASLIDNLTWFIAASWLLSYIPQSVYENDPEVVGLIAFGLLTAWFNYFAFCEWRWGQTVGKNAMGMRVISVDRGRISFGQASIRNLLRIVDFFVIGEVMIASDDKHQRLGDKAAGTVVVRKSPTEKRHYSTTPAAPAAVAGGAPDGAEASAVEQMGEADVGGRGRLPAIGWDLSNTIWGLVGGLLLALLIPIVVLPFDPDLDSDAGLLAAQALFGGALIMVAVGVASRWKFSPLRGAFEELGLRSAPLKAFGIALLMLFVYYIGVGIFASLVAQPDQEDVARELGVSDPDLLVAVSAVALIAVLAPFSEELFFRGLVFSGLRSRLSLWPAAVISGLIFGLPHVFTGPVAAIPLSVLGIGLAWLYDRTGSLWPCIFAHMINNGLALAVTS